MDGSSEIETSGLAEVLRAAPDVIAAYLFGSVARGTARPASDVDVAVLYARQPPPTLEGMGFDLADRLEARVGRPVDLVVLNGAPPDLIHRVLVDGRLLFERDRAARIRFEVQARNVYFDLAPILREYRAPRAAPVERQRMTDAELVAKKLAAIETYVAELRTLARPDAIEDDVRERSRR